MTQLGQPADEAAKGRWGRFRDVLRGAGFAVTELEASPVAHLRATWGTPPRLEVRYLLIDEFLLSTGVEAPNEYLAFDLLAASEPMRFGVHVGAETLEAVLAATASHAEPLAAGELEAFAADMQLHGLAYFMEP